MVLMKLKHCFKCKAEKPLSCFYAHPDMPDGTVNKCKECNKADVQNNYKNKIEYYKSYDKNRNRKNEQRIIALRYKGITSRSMGKGRAGYTVAGKRHLSFIAFMKWWRKHYPVYEVLYKAWADSGFNRKLTPSIDRINNDKGYMPANMQWLTLSDNCKKRFVK